MADYIPRLWQIEDGLPHNIVQTITQTSDGYLWVGTREGLARFDGIQFVEIALPGEITHPSVTALHEASDGSLWIGTAGEGPFQMQNGRLISRANVFGIADVVGIEETGGGVLWVATTDGIVAWREGKIMPETRLHELVTRICSDHRGAIWSLGRTLRKVTPTGTTILTNQTVPTNAVRGLCVDDNGVLWTGSKRGLVRIREGAASTFGTGERPRNFIATIYQDREGRLWIGSRDGLRRFADDRFVEEVDSQGMGQVNAIFEDREQNLWVGSEEGLLRLRPRLFTSYTVKEGLSESKISSVCAGPDSNIWIGTWGGGVNRFKDGSISVFRKTNGLSSDFIEAIGLGDNGNIWVGTDYQGGVNEFRDGQWIHYGLSAGLITAVADAGATVWLGTQTGLLCYSEGKFVQRTIPGGPASNLIKALCAARDGSLWIGTEAGLWQWKQQKAKQALLGTALPNSPVLTLYEDPGGTLWVGTGGSGLVRWRGGEAEAFTTGDGLLSDSIYSVVEDNQGRLWLNSSRGIFHIAKTELNGFTEHQGCTLTAVGYERWDGLPSCGQRLDSVQAGACKGSDGRLWFRTTEGVVVVDPSKVSRNALPPPLAIEGILADGKAISFSSKPVVLPPGRGELEIHLKGQRIPRSLLRGGICRERERGYNPLLWKLNSAAIVCIRSGITWSCASSTASRCFGKRSIGKPWWRRCGRLASGIGMRSRRWERTGIMCMCLLGRAGVGRRRGLCK